MAITDNERRHYEKYKDSCKFGSPEEELVYCKTISRVCIKCGKLLTLDNFGTNTAGSSPFDKDGLRYRRTDCIDCNKKQNKGKLLAEKHAKKSGTPTKAPEGTKCEVTGRTDRIVFDHDHETNRFRGWICDPVNRAVGMLTCPQTGSEIQGLFKVIKYLTKNSTEEEKQKLINDFIKIISYDK